MGKQNRGKFSKSRRKWDLKYFCEIWNFLAAEKEFRIALFGMAIGASVVISDGFGLIFM